MKKLLNYPVLLIFSAIIVFFAVGDLVTPDKEFSETENKYLAKFPKFSVSGILDSSENGFAQKYEKYTNEQFLLRDNWINIKSACETILLKIENNGIIYGKDGYMFDRFTSYDQKRYEKNIEALIEFGDNTKGIKKTLLIAPSAYAVLSDKMPVGSGNIDQAAELSKLKDTLSAHEYGYIDLYSAFTEESLKEKNQIYYKTDHHWTTDGAYAAYLEYCNYNGLNPVLFQRKTATEDFLGTHYSKCKKAGTEHEKIEYFEPSIDRIVVDGEEKQSLFDFDMLSKRDKYAFFLWGNNGVTEIENNQAEKNDTVLVIKDSYANCFVPFLTANHKNVIVVDLRSLSVNLSDVVAKYSPSEIILNYNIKNILTDTDIPRIKY